MKHIELDQWFTRPYVVALLSSHIRSLHYKEVIDPCAGNGAFRKYCTSLYDIDPKHEDIIKQDFLTLDLPYSEDRLFLTNFPYGKQAKLSIDMINHASTMAPTIATIVPKTLTKYSYQKRVNKALNLILEIDLPKNSFILDGKPKDVPSVFQIWSSVLPGTLRKEKPKMTHPDFIISSRYNTKATFIIRSVRPKVTNEIDIYDRISPNTRYYSVEPLVDGVEEMFRSIDLVSKCNSTGMPSLSISECIEIYTAKVDDWFWDNNNPTHYCIAASRKIISIDDVNKNHRGYKLSSKLDTTVLQDRFNNVPWEGTSSVSGGVFSLPKNEISKQYRDQKQP